MVERDLAKVEVAGSSPVIRSKQKIRLRRKADFLFCIIHCSHIIRRKLKPIEKAETSLKFALFGKMQVLLDKIQSKFCCILVRTMILYQRTCGNLKGSEKMLSDNIREYRKKSNMSQDELAEKLGVSRQSISLWETGQTQPTIDNIIALAKIFNISADTLLGNADGTISSQDKTPGEKTNKKLIGVIVLAIAVIIAIVGVVILVVSLGRNSSGSDEGDETGSSVAAPSSETGNTVDEPFDLFSYCKNFAIEKGTLNGDYCIYQQPAAKYGGYDNEYFSISYWGDSDMVEFCLHCPLSETQSHNFYLRMRGGYNQRYEYLSSKYYRDTGKSLRSATGYIDPAVFSDKYPLNCDHYEGSVDGQDEFMEESRVGICDLIRCLKEFVKAENMECAFSVFEFVNF